MRTSILVLYDPYCLYTLTVREHLNSFGIFMDADVQYCSVVDHATLMVDFNQYDAVIIHYSVRVALGWHISESIYLALKEFKGFKVLFVQDEYDNTDTTHGFIKHQNIKLVFTCVPTPYIKKVYPKKAFPNTKFVTNLTGYVPARLPLGTKHWNNLERRPLMIAYRGRELPAIYGELGREKLLIAQNMKTQCNTRDLPVDIEWDDSKRIYGEDWYNFLQSARASLGTESGSNVFDLSGQLRTKIEEFTEKNPEAKYTEIYEEIVAPHDNFIKMNQISPRFFECVSLGTILILFEGEYSGILKADTHYISLKKDFSNIDEVLLKLSDIELCNAMRTQAHQDIIQSQRYSYAAFINLVSKNISKQMPANRKFKTLKNPAVNDVFALCARPSTYRIHGYATDKPIDVNDFSVTPAPPSHRAKVSQSTNAQNRNFEIAQPHFPKLFTVLAPYFPRFLKRFIKRVLYGYQDPE